MLQSVAMDLEPGEGSVVAGLSGFEVGLATDGLLAGRYLRSVGVSLVDVRSDPVTGRFSVDVAWSYDNAGPVKRPARIVGRAAVTTLQWPERRTVRLVNWRPPAAQQASTPW